MPEDARLILLGPPLCVCPMQACLCVATKLTDDERLLIRDVPDRGVRVLRLLLIPADVLVHADNIERFTQGIVDIFVVPLGAHQQRCCDQAVGSSARTFAARVFRKTVRSDVFGVSFAIDHSTMDALLRSRRISSAKLLFRFGEDGGLIEVLGPVDGDFRPHHQPEPVGGPGHPLIVGIVSEAHIVATEFLCPSQQRR